MAYLKASDKRKFSANVLVQYGCGKEEQVKIVLQTLGAMS